MRQLDRSTPVVAALVVVVVGSTATVAAASGAGPVAVESVSYRGESVVAGQSTYVWQSDGHTFAVRVASSERVDAAVCLLTNGTGGPGELGCRNVTLAAGSDRTVAVSVDAWPAGLTGARTVTGVVRDRATGERLAGATTSVVVLDREGDHDGEGLGNEREVALGTDLRTRDTDSDGLDDAFEVRRTGTSPTDADTDSDGLADGTEVRTVHADPTDRDTDGDGLADGREVQTGTVPTRADTDGDGLADGAEVTRYQTNATRADTDGDGLADGAEVTEHGTNPRVPDTDGDGLPDGAEVHVYGTDPARADTDGDGLDDGREVGVTRTDPTRADTDGDGLADGDEAERGTDPLAPDTDGDGLADGREVQVGSDPTDRASTADPGVLRRALWAASNHPLVAGAAAAAVALTGAAALVVRYGDRLPGGRVAGRLGVGRLADLFPAGAGATDGGSSGPRGGSGAAESGAAAPDGFEGGAAASGDTPARDAPGESGAADLAFMTNEERVRYLLDEHGGRMLQSDIVAAADWSKATVSRVLSRMEEEGAVTRIDVGKGNLVTLPGDEPASAESPFSE